MGEKEHQKKKNPCIDCSFCQYCADARCAMCRCPIGKEKKKNAKKEHKPLFLKY
jgi:hypothetical protein